MLIFGGNISVSQHNLVLRDFNGRDRITFYLDFLTHPFNMLGQQKREIFVYNHVFHARIRIF